MGLSWSLPQVWGTSESVAGVIYQVRGGGKVYVGSTVERDLQRRLRVHEASLRAWKKGKGGYCSVFEVLKEGQYEIVLLEEVRSSDRHDLRQREGYYFKLFGDAVVNLRNPYRHQWDKKRQHRNAMRNYQRRTPRLKAKVKARNRERVRCEACNVWVSVGYRSQHERTYKHLQNYSTFH